MASRRVKPVCTPNGDISFPPPFQDQAKYLALADQFLAEKPKRQQKLHPIDAFRKGKGKRVA